MTNVPKDPNPQVPECITRPRVFGLWLHGYLGVSLLLSGCGNADLPPTIPVMGTVTVNGQSCPGPGSLRFMPMSAAEGLPRRPGRAEFGLDGRFKVTSFRDGDGLVPGTYKVQLECWKTPPADGQPGVSYLSAAFQPPDLAVERDQVSVNFDIDATK